MLNKDLIDYCTPRQREIVQAVIKEGTHRKAAKSLGVAKNTVDYHLKQVRRQAARKGLTESMDLRSAIPQDTHTLGKCTVHLKDGEIQQVWARAETDREEMASIAREMADHISSGIKPFSRFKPPRRDLLKTRMAAYVIADLHVGMYAWAEETGADYDCRIASELLIHSMRALLARTPDTETAIIAQLGDFLHMTDETNETPRGRNRLDVDTRWKRVVRIAEDLYIEVINEALQKHNKVDVYNIRGNHDMYTAYMLGRTLQRAYENNPRVTIHNDEVDYMFHRFGSSLIGLAHGHLAKPKELGDKMMEHCRDQVGSSRHCYWWSGHIHHETVERFGWYSHESFTTLAANDAHHAAKYTSNRTMDAIIIDEKYGIRDRSTVTVDEIEDAMQSS